MARILKSAKSSSDGNYPSVSFSGPDTACPDY
jgi:hypothetical protein